MHSVSLTQTLLFFKAQRVISHIKNGYYILTRTVCMCVYIYTRKYSVFASVRYSVRPCK